MPRPRNPLIGRLSASRHGCPDSPRVQRPRKDLGRSSTDRRTYHMTRATCSLLIAALVAAVFTTLAYAQQAKSNSTGSQKDTPHLEFVFEEFVTLGASIHPGETPFGERNIVPITGGTFSGPNIQGKVMSGGWDWQLATKTGCHSIQADYMIQTDDGAIINVIN